MAVSLIRHGRTDWNAARRIQGKTDIPLNETGVCQAEALAETLSICGETFSRVYTGDLARARRTAEIIAARLHLPVTVVPALTELSFGDWEGRSWDEIRQTDGEALSVFEAGGLDVRAPRGESYREMLLRVLSALTSFPKDENVIAVSHGGVIRALRNLLADKPFAFYEFDAVENATVTRVEHDALTEAFLTLSREKEGKQRESGKRPTDCAR